MSFTDQNPHDDDLGLPGFNQSTATVHNHPSVAHPPVQPIAGTTATRKEGNIPQMNSPISADTLVEEINLTMTIGEDDRVEGKIIAGKGKAIVIRGTVVGEIISQGLVVVMKEARIQGSIKASQVWVEGEVTASQDGLGKIDAGTLHIGCNALVKVDCVFDQISIATPNRGIKGRLDSRDSLVDNA